MKSEVKQYRNYRLETGEGCTTSRHILMKLQDTLDLEGSQRDRTDHQRNNRMTILNSKTKHCLKVFAKILLS